MAQVQKAVYCRESEKTHRQVRVPHYFQSICIQEVVTIPKMECISLGRIKDHVGMKKASKLHVGVDSGEVHRRKRTQVAVGICVHTGCDCKT